MYWNTWRWLFTTWRCKCTKRQRERCKQGLEVGRQQTFGTAAHRRGAGRQRSTTQCQDHFVALQERRHQFCTTNSLRNDLLNVSRWMCPLRRYGIGFTMQVSTGEGHVFESSDCLTPAGATGLGWRSCHLDSERLASSSVNWWVQVLFWLYIQERPLWRWFHHGLEWNQLGWKNRSSCFGERNNDWVAVLG